MKSMLTIWVVSTWNEHKVGPGANKAIHYASLLTLLRVNNQTALQLAVHSRAFMIRVPLRHKSFFYFLMDVHDWLSVALNRGQHFRQSMAPEKRRAQSFAHMCPVYDYKAWWFLITVVVLLMKWPFTSSPAAVLLNDGDDRWDASLERAQLSVSARFGHRLPRISHFASIAYALSSAYAMVTVRRAPLPTCPDARF